LKISSTDLPASEKRDFHTYSKWEERSELRPGFVGKTGLIIGGQQYRKPWEHFSMKNG